MSAAEFRGNMAYSLGDSPGEQRRLLRQVALYGDTQTLRFAEGETVCELGCGAGANLWIAERVKQGRYIGADASEYQVEAARQRGREMGLANTEFHVRDAANSGLPDDSTDVVFCRCLLIHQPDPAAIVAEIGRITRPGGRVVLIEPHGPAHYCTPGKSNLMKCFHARTELAYGAGRGSPDVALNLFPLLVNAGWTDIELEPHVITALGSDAERCRAFMEHWLGIIEPAAEALLAEGAITREELRLAHEEAANITPDMFVCQTMWRAQAKSRPRERSCAGAD